MSLEPSIRRRFVALTEGMVSPKAVAALYSRAEMLARLPLPVQRWIVRRAGGDTYMGFIVDPYCLFLAYEVQDAEAARALLPRGYELVPTSMFADGAPRYCAIVGAFNLHASVFWGNRVELYLIAENTRTGMLTWVICDYESNTINYDPGQGFSAATTNRSVITTTHAGEVLIDVESKQRPNRLQVTASLPGSRMRRLDQRLWLDGNLSIDYGGRLADDDSVPFGLIFDPGEMAQALHLPREAVAVEANTFGAGVLAPEPFEAACFPYAQHFLTTSYPRETPIADGEALLNAARSHAAAAPDRP
jgi:hypothetical protein